MCIHSTLLHHDGQVTCYFCKHLEVTTTGQLATTPPPQKTLRKTDKPRFYESRIVETKATRKALPQHHRSLAQAWEEEKKNSNVVIAAAEEKHRRLLEREQARHTAAFNAQHEGGHPLAWHFVVPLPKPSDEVLKLFRSSSSKQLWLQKMYDFVFPEDNATQEAKQEYFKGQTAYHHRIWDSIALGKTTPQTKRVYQGPKFTPLLYTIYSAPKTERTFTRWEGKSKFSDLASAEDRAQCHPAKFSITHASGFSETDQPVREETTDQRTLRQASALTLLPAFRYTQDSEGFGKKFFEMPLDEGEEGELFLPSTKSSHGRTEGRELGRSDATLVFDKTTSTFYLQKVKQKKKAALRGKILRKERKRADAKLPLFSLPALEKVGAVELLSLWDTITEKVKYLHEWKLVPEKLTGAEYLRDDKELMRRFLHLTVQFCSKQAVASIKYNSAVSLSVHRPMNLEEQDRLICNSSGLEVTEDYAKWVTRAYALLMLPAGARGSVRGLGWPDQRYWEPFRNFEGKSPTSPSAEKQWKEDQEEQSTEQATVTEVKYTIRNMQRMHAAEQVQYTYEGSEEEGYISWKEDIGKELITTADLPRQDDWEGSTQQQAIVNWEDTAPRISIRRK